MQKTLNALDEERNLRQTKVDELSTENKDLKKKLSSTAPNIKKLEDQVAMLHSEAAALNAELQISAVNLKKEKASTGLKQDHLSTQNTNLRNEVSRLEKNNTDTSIEINVLQKRIDTMDVALDEAMDQVADLETILSSREGSLTQSNKALKSARAEIDELRKSENESTKKQDGYQQQIKALTAKSNSAQGVINARDSQLITMTRKLSRTQQNSDQAESKIALLEKSLETEKAAVAQANVERDKSKKLIDRAASEITSLEKDNSALQQKNKTLRTTIAELQNDRSDLTQKPKVPTKVPGSEVLQLRDAIEQQLAKAELTEIMVQSIDDNQAVAITLGSDSLYRKADVSLTRDGSRILNKVGNVVASYPGWRIQVEGHTDSRPIGTKLRKRYPSNQELSLARASSVVEFFSLTTAIKSESLSSKGYAETKPVGDNATAEGREKNRRVDIILKR